MDDGTGEITARQRGLITHAQARSVGLSASAIRHRIARGDWVRVRTGLYRRSGTPRSWEQTVLAAVLGAGPQAWTSHATAAELWGFPLGGREPIEITVLLERRPRLERVRVHRSGTLVDADLREIDGIPVLSPARTLVDLSARVGVRDLGALVDDGLRRRVLTLPALHAVARRLPTIAPGRSPKTVERVLLDRVGDYQPGGSNLEVQVFDILVGAGFPPPVRQHRVVVDGSTYFLDLAYPERHLAIEVDGFEFHRERAVFDADRSRQNDLVRAGWTVLRFTSRSTRADILATVRPFLFGP